MFAMLKNFIEEMTGPDPVEREFAEDDFRLAAAALLVHVAEIDGFFAETEKRSLLLLLQERFDLEAGSAHRLIVAAQKSDREAVDLYSFTSILKQTMTLPERRRLIEMMWQLAYADGDVHEFEENVIWRVSELLGVSANDRIALRRKVREECGHDPDAPGPWEKDGPWESAEANQEKHG